jgi:hypothetical protein
MKNYFKKLLTVFSHSDIVKVFPIGNRHIDSFLTNGGFYYEKRNKRREVPSGNQYRRPFQVV